jgi:hypothetical protein
VIVTALQLQSRRLSKNGNNGRFGEPRSVVCIVRSPNRPSGGLAVIVMWSAGARLAPCRDFWIGPVRHRPATLRNHPLAPSDPDRRPGLAEDRRGRTPHIFVPHACARIGFGQSGKLAGDSKVAFGTFPQHHRCCGAKRDVGIHHPAMRPLARPAGPPPRPPKVVAIRRSDGRGGKSMGEGEGWLDKFFGRPSSSSSGLNARGTAITPRSVILGLRAEDPFQRPFCP